MLSCAVKFCGKNSDNSSRFFNGISFYKFPQEAYLKEKWIDATKRDNWFPREYSVICSRHFSQDCFVEVDNARRLLNDAIPTLLLPIITDENNNMVSEDEEEIGSNQPNNVDPLFWICSVPWAENVVPQNQPTFTSNTPIQITAQVDNDEGSESSELNAKENKQLRKQVAYLSSKIKNKNKVIKNLGESIRYLKKRVKYLKEIEKEYLDINDRQLRESFVQLWDVEGDTD